MPAGDDAEVRFPLLLLEREAGGGEIVSPRHGLSVGGSAGLSGAVDRPLRIAYLVPASGISGGQRVVFAQARELARRGHAVTIVCPESRPGWFDLGGVEWEQKPFAASAALARAQIRVATFWSTVAPAMEGSTGPVFHLCQGYEADFSFYAADRERIRAAYALPTRKLVIAPHLAERLAAEGHANVAIVGQVFEAAEFPPAPARQFDREMAEVLLVGPFEADMKGIREALAAIAMARGRGVPLRLRRIATTPPPEQERALSLAARFDVGVSPREMSRAYQAADLLIGPSHPEEGFGLPVLEALSSGLPSVLSDTPGHRFIARDAAVYFRCGDAAALAEALARLARDAGARRTLSRLGPAEASRFTTGEVVDRILEEALTALKTGT